MSIMNSFIYLLIYLSKTIYEHIYKDICYANWSGRQVIRLKSTLLWREKWLVWIYTAVFETSLVSYFYTYKFYIKIRIKSTYKWIWSFLMSR